MKRWRKRKKDSYKEHMEEFDKIIKMQKRLEKRAMKNIKKSYKRINAEIEEAKKFKKMQNDAEEP